MTFELNKVHVPAYILLLRCKTNTVSCMFLKDFVNLIFAVSL